LSERVTVSVTPARPAVPMSEVAPPMPAAEVMRRTSRQLEFRRRLERAVRDDARAALRLGRAGTSVAFRVGDDTASSATLLLDRQPPEVRDGSEPAEVIIELTLDAAARFLRGELVLGTAIYSGLVTCRGPVRQYLGVDPILRGQLRRGHDEVPSELTARDAGADPEGRA
jgi:hypothetical protein